jgi:hypothetical protein
VEKLSDGVLRFAREQPFVPFRIICIIEFALSPPPPANPNDDTELPPANITILNAPSELLGFLFLRRGDYRRWHGIIALRFLGHKSHNANN